MGRIRAFTLVEILVVVAVIVILIAILVPALDKAMTAAHKAKCLANQRNVAQVLAGYSLENHQYYPPYTQPGAGVAHAYDLRTTDGASAGAGVNNVVGVGAGVGSGSSDAGVNSAGVTVNSGTGNRYPLGLGILVLAKQLPTTQLGKVIHCPSMDNKDGQGTQDGHCMDLHNANGYGGSFWTEFPGERIIGAYNYRATSYGKSGHGALRQNKLATNFVVLMDTPDLRWRGFKGLYVHPDGYSRVFVDGSGAFYSDPTYEVDRIVGTGNSGNNNTTVDGVFAPATDEKVFDYVAVQH
jgi:prepilin-type N-terminal cleavage/methylation domain-containing protein